MTQSTDLPILTITRNGDGTITQTYSVNGETVTMPPFRPKISSLQRWLEDGEVPVTWADGGMTVFRLEEAD
jgi:hypothetical protein